MLSRGAAEAAAVRFKALSDPTRLQILSMLAASGTELCACDIESAFDLSQPTISHHLKLLRAAGFVLADKRGLWVFYSLAKEGLAQAQQVLGGFAAIGIGSRFDRRGPDREQSVGSIE